MSNVVIAGVQAQRVDHFYAAFEPLHAGLKAVRYFEVSDMAGKLSDYIGIAPAQAELEELVYSLEIEAMVGDYARRKTVAVIALAVCQLIARLGSNDPRHQHAHRLGRLTTPQ